MENKVLDLHIDYNCLGGQYGHCAPIFSLRYTTDKKVTECNFDDVEWINVDYWYDSNPNSLINEYFNSMLKRECCYRCEDEINDSDNPIALYEATKSVFFDKHNGIFWNEIKNSLKEWWLNRGVKNATILIVRHGEFSDGNFHIYQKEETN